MHCMFILLFFFILFYLAFKGTRIITWYSLFNEPVRGMQLFLWIDLLLTPVLDGLDFYSFFLSKSVALHLGDSERAPWVIIHTCTSIQKNCISRFFLFVLVCFPDTSVFMADVNILTSAG